MRRFQTNQDQPEVELTEEQLKEVSGGFTSAEHTVVAPRDSVSGNATGRRAYRPAG